MNDDRPNATQARFWNEQGGPRWVQGSGSLDAQLRPLGLRAMERAAPTCGERALDVGCGCGDTTLELARRVGREGSVTGLDVSEPMLARARERLAETGLGNARFVLGDAQVHPFGELACDLVYSRFGLMFFDSPVAAFANLRSAARAGGRLAFVCIRGRDENPWMRVPDEAAGAHLELPPPSASGAPGPFGLADGERLRAILAGAGWADVALEALDEAVLLGGGGTMAETLRFLQLAGPLVGPLAAADEATRERALEAVRRALEPHQVPEGVRLPGAFWLVTARS